VRKAGLQAIESRAVFAPVVQESSPDGGHKRDGRTSVLVFISLLDARKLPELREIQDCLI
jgi:hypothetical protein